MTIKPLCRIGGDTFLCEPRVGVCSGMFGIVTAAPILTAPNDRRCSPSPARTRPHRPANVSRASRTSDRLVSLFDPDARPVRKRPAGPADRVRLRP
jgi:hypothetical protein